METIIELLKAAVEQYKKGMVKNGDRMLTTAVKIRREDAKAKKEIAEAKAPAKTDGDNKS